MFSTISLFLLISILSQSVGVLIHTLEVPSAVEVGSENVVLDCKFQYNETEKHQLEVKWYFNEDQTPFIQWIAGRGGDFKPQLIGGKFENKLDLSFSRGTDNYTMYRALMIHRPTLDMAGTYTCKVSSFENESIQKSNMIVYSPVSSSNFKQARIGRSKVNITCEISGIFPLPDVKLTWGSFALFEDSVIITPHNDSFDILIHKTLEHSELPAETVFGCEITIPGTEYFIREEAIYHHRGRRSIEMEKIKELEQMRQRKSKQQQVFYNTDSRIDAEAPPLIPGSTANLLASSPYLAVIFLLLTISMSE